LYCAVGHESEHQLQTIIEASGIDSERKIIALDFDLDDVTAESISDALDTNLPELGDHPTVLIDPINSIETNSEGEAAELTQAVKSAVEDHGGLGILYGVEVPNQPAGRWVTTTNADAVFRLDHRLTKNDIETQLLIDRLPTRQNLRDSGGNRSFELPLSADLTLDTSKTLSP
jgi:hypothetical protein